MFEDLDVGGVETVHLSTYVISKEIVEESKEEKNILNKEDPLIDLNKMK